MGVREVTEGPGLGPQCLQMPVHLTSTILRRSRTYARSVSTISLATRSSLEGFTEPWIPTGDRCSRMGGSGRGSGLEAEQAGDGSPSEPTVLREVELPEPLGEAMAGAGGAAKEGSEWSGLPRHVFL